MGFALAEEAAERGAEVTLVTGPVNLTTSNPQITDNQDRICGGDV